MLAQTLTVKKRSGEHVAFDKTRIINAMQAAFHAQDMPIHEDALEQLTEEVIQKLIQYHEDTSIGIETIQDTVEEILMSHGYITVSKAYILYRSKRAELREKQHNISLHKPFSNALSVVKKNNKTEPFKIEKIQNILKRLTKDMTEVDCNLILTELQRNITDSISSHKIETALVLSAKAFIERDPQYNKLASRLLRQQIYREVFRQSANADNMETLYKNAFQKGITDGVAHNIYNKDMLSFDFPRLCSALRIERDDLLLYLGIQTLHERYLLKINNSLIETPQHFWMRVAMGLSLREKNPTERAIEFYEVLSNLLFLCSTPTLFHSGTTHAQMSSCYVSTITDDLTHIFKCIGDNAQMSKWSGGIGNDWTGIRATGSLIKSTKVESQGVIPFLKVANDTTVAINRSGKRRGATCAYLETWHLDIEDFLDLRRNTGDERRRTHDMNTANWIPDLFMKRVLEKKHWTLFSPSDVPDLHDLYGKAFEQRYTHYEKLTQSGEISHYKTIEAVKLWRKMLTRLFETGHPWLTFKDPCNIRSPQDHAGVIHNSNLCTEITLNNSKHETAVCNLGSINILQHVEESGVNHFLLEKTINTAIRMLDNVIDINFYPTAEAHTSNIKHRPIGLGIMGLQDSLFTLHMPIDSKETQEFMDTTMEFISYHAIFASSKLAGERGTYQSYQGSKWSRGIFPLDTVALLEAERGMPIPINRNTSMDWDFLKEQVQKFGMRNSNTMAIAPTATIANIAGVYPSIEPIYKNLYVKSNMSGEFTVINEYLVNELKAQKLWNEEMLNLLKYYDGNIAMIANIPNEIKNLYKEAFSIDPTALLTLTAIRGKWIDQSQSTNIFIQGKSGNIIHEVYTTAWKLGLKTTYYLRSLAASQIEKSTLDAGRFAYTQKRQYHQPQEVSACSILDSECEACQ